MTMTALNLRVDKECVQKAKELARQSGTSLSFLVDTFLKSLNTMNTPIDTNELHPLLRNLAGSISSTKENVREAVGEELERKYGS